MQRDRRTGPDVLAAELLSRVTGPDTRARDLLPRVLKDAVYGRKSTQIPKTRQYFMRFTDTWKYSTDEEWEELTQVNQFLQIQFLYHTKGEDDLDDAPLIFYHAEVPETMLQIIHRSFDPEYAHATPKVRCLPYLATEILGTFLHKPTPTFALLPEKLFRDLSGGINDLSDVLTGKLTWVESLAVVRFFGTASFNPNCSVWLNTRSDTYRVLCEYTYRASEVVEEKIHEGEVQKRDEYLTTLIQTFRRGEDLVLSARLMGLLTINHAVFVFHNHLQYSLYDYNSFLKTAEAIKQADVLGHFSFIVKQLMIWVEPGQSLNYLLIAIRHCMDMNGGVEGLFIDNLAYCKKHNIPPGIESLKYWKHATLWPSRLGWFLCHALLLNDSMGSGCCIYVLLFILNNLHEEVTNQILEIVGPELIDLAHLTRIEYPSKMNVQASILEALLRYGGVSHKLHNKQDTFEGTLRPAEEMPEFCVEAALFSRRAHLEGKLSYKEKQKRVSKADDKKDQGNRSFKAGRYKEAIELYTEALALCPLAARSKQALYYSNRAECYVRSNDAMKAVHDCNRSLCLDKSAKVKVQWRRSRAYQKLNLDYPAWVDMKCIEGEWNLTREQSGIDFHQLLAHMGEDLGILDKGVFSDLERQVWKEY